MTDTVDSASTTPTTKIAPLRLPCETRILDKRYRVRRLIGRGGMADVFLADDQFLERTVAIKILHQSLAEHGAGLERFRREAIALAAVSSANIVRLYDAHFAEHCAYLVLQHIEGATIENEVTRNGPMDRTRAATLLTQVLDGLATVHANGLVHRDIKPANVLLEANDHVVLVDFGIALNTRRAPLTAPGMVAGTPGYLAPEHHVEPASDVYQVGLLMLFLLTGVDCGQASAGEAAIEALVERLPGALADVARRALATDPTKRFASAETMKAALRAALAVPRETCTVIAPSSQPAALREERATTEIAAADLLGLLSDTSPDASRGQTDIRVAARTTAVKAAQIVSAHPSREATVRHRPRVRMPILAARSDEQSAPAVVGDGDSQSASWIVGVGGSRSSSS